MIVPAYDAEATIGSTIRSILAQTRHDFEVVVVDDGSTDETVARVEELRQHDPRVHLIQQENAGVAAARNAGIAASTATYVSFLDSDDLFMTSYLDSVGSTLDSNPKLGIAFSDAWILDDKTRRIHRATLMTLHPPPKPLPEDPVDLLRLLLRGNFIPSAATARRAALDRVGGFNGMVTPAEDWELWLRVIAHGYGLAAVPGMHVIYRDRETSLSSDLVVLEDAVRRVYEVVLAEYELPNSVRAVAEEELEAVQARLVDLRTRPPRSRSRLALSAIKQRLLWRRRFHARVPLEIGRAFPDLQAL